ncbi:hypothetical protein F5884DRAFT_881403 [Xylogone sp. PMI_703]|nr:hypothetical protein F5884DRAFT_881403 [Xylogone sp. PMI_703]
MDRDGHPLICTCTTSQKPESSSFRIGEAKSFKRKDDFEILIQRTDIAPQPLKFVISNGPPPEKDDKSRRVIRSHVMTNFRREQRLKTTPPLRSPDNVTTKKSICPECGGEIYERISKSSSHPQNLQGPRIQGSERPISLNSWMDASRSDPFNSLPIQLDYHSKILYDHFTHYFILLRIPTPRNPANSWSSYVMQDPAMLSSALVLSASHWVLIGGMRTLIAPTYYHHKAEAIRIINERLTDSRQAICDSTLSSGPYAYAISKLIYLQSTDGMASVAKIHMDGLEQLLNLRLISADTEVSGLLQRADQLSAKTGNSAPRFELHGTKIRKLQASLKPIVPATTISSGSGQYNESRMFDDLRRLTEQSERNLNRQDAFDNAGLNTYIEEVSHNLFNLAHEGEIDTNDARSSYSWKLYPVSGQIYLDYFIRRLSRDNPMIQYYVTNLKEAIENVGATVILGDPYMPKLMFWILTIGGTFTKMPSERFWFKTELFNVTAYLGLDSWEDARDILREFVWMHESRENICREFWDEMRTM